MAGETECCEGDVLDEHASVPVYHLQSSTYHNNPRMQGGSVLTRLLGVLLQVLALPSSWKCNNDGNFRQYCPPSSCVVRKIELSRRGASVSGERRRAAVTSGEKLVGKASARGEERISHVSLRLAEGRPPLRADPRASTQLTDNRMVCRRCTTKPNNPIITSSQFAKKMLADRRQGSGRAGRRSPRLPHLREI